MGTDKKSRSPFGDYRSVHTNIWDDRDFQRLSPLAKSLWFYLKCKLGQYGIDVVYFGGLPEILNASRKAVEKALAELESPKPRRAEGWVLHEENVYWLIKGFRFDPWLQSTKDNYKLGAGRHLQKLPQLRILESFRSFYQLSGGDSPLPSPTPYPNTETETERATATVTESEPESERKTDGDQPIITGMGAAELMQSRIVYRFAHRFYKDAERERRESVVRQLQATLQGGTLLRKGVVVRAIDLGHLEMCCAAVIANPPHDPNVAIVHVLQKLTNPVLNDRGETVTEATKSNRENAEREDDLRFARLEKENPEKAAEFQEHAENAYPGSDPETKVMQRAFYRTCFQKWLSSQGVKAA